MNAEDNDEPGRMQARQLRAQAQAGGLRFEAYLPPDLTDWLLERIADGMFADPSEAVFAIVAESQELEPHRDLRDEVLAELRRKWDNPRPTPARWAAGAR